MVINHQGEQAQRLHAMLVQRLSDNISLYKQGEQQPDVWQALNGKKDDFLIYNRCGRLTHHISLPYSIIGHGHIESAIKEAYCNRMCGDCSHETAETPEECKAKPNAQPDADAPSAVGDNTEHDHSRHHGHGHGHHGHQGQHGHHGHRHHGDHHGFHSRGFGHDHDHHHGNHNGHGSDLEQSQQGIRQHDQGYVHGQHHLDSHQLQQPVDTQQLLQEVLAAPVRP
ncbi:hypothetical protein ATANTOWER_021321 [Ataeniobius toweri]|uniref:Selenoprotein P N-terminal domain-containing protein n=1 Tax=Ataeniobius toweri TaxID=208326 RepID=A0ABU7BXY9_9TELE|nr:hypothetical protein [Ataeniobius toweri]